MKPQCPINNKACSTSYTHNKCRCDACKAWKSAKGKADYWANPEAAAEKSRQEWKRNGQKPHRIASRKEYWDNGGSERHKAWQKEVDTPERRAKAAAKTKAWTLANPERKANADREYRQKNKEKMQEYRKAHYQANSAAYKERATARRQKQMELETHLKPAEKAAITRLYTKAEKLRAEGWDVHIDHVKPLNKGGQHHPSNLAIITAGDNLYKGDREPYLCAVPLGGIYRS